MDSPPPITDPPLVSSIESFWNTSVQVSIVGIFLLAFGTILILAQTLILPIVSAIIFGLILSPAAAQAARYHIPSWLFAIMAVGLIVFLLNLVIALLSAPIVEWAGKAPEIATTIKDKLQILNRPLASFKDLQAIISQGGNSGFNIDTASLAKAVLAFLTPALGELLLFFATLFFLLIGRTELRGHAVLFFEDRDTRLLIIRILNDIEQNLTRYIGTVSMINLCV